LGKKQREKGDLIAHEISFCSFRFHSTMVSPPAEYPILPSSEKAKEVTFFVWPLGGGLDESVDERQNSGKRRKWQH